jgi:hypothetical protein
MKIFLLKGGEPAHLAMGMQVQVFAPDTDYVAAAGVSEDFLERANVFDVREVEDPQTIAVTPAAKDEHPLALVCRPVKPPNKWTKAELLAEVERLGLQVETNATVAVLIEAITAAQA